MEIPNTTLEVILLALAVSLGLNLYHSMKDWLPPFFGDNGGGRKNKLTPEDRTH
jgi:hypothetical protein